MLLQDYHSHLCWSEVLGYLGGRYDTDKNGQLVTLIIHLVISSPVVQILQAFPCCGSEEDSAAIEKSVYNFYLSINLSMHPLIHSLIHLYIYFICPFILSQVQEKMMSANLQVVGWYHSHPSSEATPSINDVTQQLSYQESISTNKGEEPCVGLIISQSHDFHVIMI